MCLLWFSLLISSTFLLTVDSSFQLHFLNVNSKLNLNLCDHRWPNQACDNQIHLAGYMYITVKSVPHLFITLKPDLLRRERKRKKPTLKDNATPSISATCYWKKGMTS